MTSLSQKEDCQFINERGPPQPTSHLRRTEATRRSQPITSGGQRRNEDRTPREETAETDPERPRPTKRTSSKTTRKERADFTGDRI